MGARGREDIFRSVIWREDVRSRGEIRTSRRLLCVVERHLAWTSVWKLLRSEDRLVSYNRKPQVAISVRRVGRL